MRPDRSIVAAAVLALLVGSGQAKAAPPELEGCFHEAADRYDVAAPLLMAIAEVESSFRPDAINRGNGNGTYDVGVMQINSWWFPRLERDYGITETDLMEPCMNIKVGAWILATNFQQVGWSWQAIGAYNAGTGRGEERERLRLDYAERVYAALERY